jgi:hypothetical protein
MNIPQCWEESMTFWCVSGIVPPDLDPTPFFSKFKDAKKLFPFSSYFFLILYALFQSAQPLYEKSERSGPGFVPLTNG